MSIRMFGVLLLALASQAHLAFADGELGQQIRCTADMITGTEFQSAPWQCTPLGMSRPINCRARVSLSSSGSLVFFDGAGDTPDVTSYDFNGSVIFTDYPYVNGLLTFDPFCFSGGQVCISRRAAEHGKFMCNDEELAEKLAQAMGDGSVRP